MIIEVKSPGLNYKLDIGDTNPVIIEGKSASGKSILIKMIEDARKNPSISMKAEKTLIHLNIDLVRNGLPVSEDKIYIMDEDDGINEPEIVKAINSKRFKFIIISRDTSILQLSYGINNIFEFKNSGKYNMLEQKYKKINKNDINMYNIDTLIAEDSGSGLDFYKNYDNLNVSSSNGNSNIINTIKDNSVLVFDEIGFGPFIKNVLIKIKYLNCYCIYPKSFEYMLLDSNIIKTRRTEDFRKLEYYESEEMYFKILKELCVPYKIKYNKTYLDKWFLQEPQFSKINQYIIENFRINLKECNSSKNQISLNWS